MSLWLRHDPGDCGADLTTRHDLGWLERESTGRIERIGDGDRPRIGLSAVKPAIETT